MWENTIRTGSGEESQYGMYMCKCLDENAQYGDCAAQFVVYVHENAQCIMHMCFECSGLETSIIECKRLVGHRTIWFLNV